MSANLQKCMTTAPLTTSINELFERGVNCSVLARLLNRLGLARIRFLDDSRELAAAVNALTDEQRAAPIDLLKILEHNGLDSCLYVIRDVLPTSNTTQVLSELKPLAEQAWKDYKRLTDALGELYQALEDAAKAEYERVITAVWKDCRRAEELAAAENKRVLTKALLDILASYHKGV